MPPTRSALRELARLFLKLGTIAFGGPAAHVALMREEVVRRRGWLSEQEFLDLLGAANMIPGPNSTELAIHVGYSRAGWAGLLVAGASFVLPATLLAAALGWVYVQYGSLPELQDLLYGVKAAVIVVIVQALAVLGRAAIKSTWLAVVGLAALGANAAGVNELIVLSGAAVVCALVKARTMRGSPLLVPLTGLGALAGASASMLPATLPLLFGVFLKIGAILFGSGYVLFAFMQADLVDRYHWLTEQQLLDAVAVGQFTPGPVSTTVTFIGYVLRGVPGAAVATLGMFLPAFVYVAASAPLIPRLRASQTSRAFLDGLNVASLALMTVVTWRLGRSALVDTPAIAVAIVSGLFLWRTHINSAWLLLGAALAGLVVR